MFFRHTRTIVGYAEIIKLMVIAQKFHRCSAAVARIGQGIVYHVPENGIQQITVAAYGHTVGNVHDDFRMMSLLLRLHILQYGRNDTRQIAIGFLIQILVLGEFVQGGNVLYKCRKPLRLLVGTFNEEMLLFGRQARIGQNAFQIAGDPRHRRAQLVGNVLCQLAAHLYFLVLQTACKPCGNDINHNNHHDKQCRH